MTDLFTIGMKADTSDLKRGSTELDRFSKSSKGVETQTKKTNSAVRAAAASFASFIAVTRSVNAITTFDDAILGLNATLRTTTANMSKLEDQARSLGASSVFSATEAANAQRFLAQAGFETLEVLSATPTALRLAQAGTLDLASAADIASNVLGGMRLEIDQFNRVADVMAETAASSNTNISQLGNALSYVAPVASGAGLSIEETAAAIGKLGDNGLQGTRAGTGLLGVIRQLSKPSDEAEAALSKYGLALADVNIESLGLVSVLENVRDSGLSTADMFRVFGSEAQPAASILMENVSALTQLTDSLGGAEGAAEDMAKIMSSGLSASFRSLNSQVNESVLQMGDSGLTAVLQGVTDGASGVLAVYNDMLGEFADANDLTLEQQKNLESLADTIQDTATFLALAAGGYAAYATAVGTATAATAAFNVVTKANPLGLMVTALGLGVAALYSFSDSADDASESMRILADETGRFNDKQIESANTALLLEQAEIVKEITRLEEMRATQSGRTANATTIRIEKEKEKLAEIASLQASLLDREEARAESVALNMSAAYSRYQSARLSQIESESNALNSLGKQYQLYQMLRNDATADASAADDFNKLALEYEVYQDARNSGEAANAVNLQSQYKLYQYLRSEAENIEQLPTPFDNWASAIDLAAESFAGLQSGVLGGTAEMEVAVDALNALQAVNAVINQSGGDPYTSFARMATMAASMASLGYSIGGLGGSFSDTSAEAQASQGTGTVLGSSDKQSESIANGIEDIESVNSSLLSVNYLMLSELQSLNSSIAGASAEIASNVSYDGVGNLGSFSSNPLEDLHSSVGLGSVYDVIDSLNLGVLSSIGSFFGGSSNVSDEGINIIGGTISDIVNNTTAAAFQEVQTRRYRWSSTDTNTYTSAVSDSVENQFDSIYQGIVDTVAAGASAIGFSDNQISSVISSYVFDSINISLKDMSAEEQTAALEGVFSSAFDSLAAHMFPFLSEFQEAGEGFGETLTRIATELQVADKVAERFGQSLSSGTVGNIRLADAMAEVSGGADVLASNLSGFTSSFYTEAEQAAFLFSDLTDIFSTLGMTVPDTAEGFRELVEAQNLNTIAGAENVATLLALQSSASEYYDLLEEADSVYDDLIDFVEDLLGLAADGTQTLASAQAAYIEGLELAATGDEDAISELSSLTQTYLDLFAAQASTGTEVLANRVFVASQIEAVATQDDIPAFANGGSHTGGWRLVGERGPEMEYTGASTIYNNNDTSKMFDNSDIIAAVESLHKMMGFNLNAINTNTRKMTNLAQLWDNSGIPINSETPVNVAVV